MNTNPSCANCFFATRDLIPDRAFVWGVDGDKKTKAKPKVPGFRCHISKPTINGFPATVESDFCTFYTEPATLRQPFRHLTESAIVTNSKTTEG